MYQHLMDEAFLYLNENVFRQMSIRNAFVFSSANLVWAIQFDLVVKLSFSHISHRNIVDCCCYSLMLFDCSLFPIPEVFFALHGVLIFTILCGLCRDSSPDVYLFVCFRKFNRSIQNNSFIFTNWSICKFDGLIEWFMLIQLYLLYSWIVQLVAVVPKPHFQQNWSFLPNFSNKPQKSFLAFDHL